MESVKRGRERRNKCIKRPGTAHFFSLCLLVATTFVLILPGPVHGQNRTLETSGPSAVSGKEAVQSRARGQGPVLKVNQKMNQSSFKAALNAFNFKFLNVVTSKEKTSTAGSPTAGSPTKNVFYSPLSISTALGMVLAGSNGTTRDQIMAVLGLGPVGEEAVDRSSFGREEFEKVIAEYTSKPSGSRVLANRMILNEGFEAVDSFKAVIRESYRCEISSQPLSEGEIVPSVNEWVNEKTKGLVHGLIDSPFDPLTQIVILNVIYFKDDWTKRFNRDRTVGGSFNNIDGSHSDILTMRKKERVRFLLNEQFNYSMIEMLYKNGNRNRSPSPSGSSSQDNTSGSSSQDNTSGTPIGKDNTSGTSIGKDNTSGTSMVILLPHEEKGIEKLLSDASSFSQVQEDVLKNIRKAFKVETDIYLPRFEMETSYDLKETLAELGMGSLFDGATCDLSGISGKRPSTRNSTIETSTSEGSKSVPESNTIESASSTVSDNNLHVSNVIHKAKLIVNEEGSEAAAVTQMAISYRSMPLTEEFNVDHPFIFFIKDGDVITFTGIVYKL